MDPIKTGVIVGGAVTILMTVLYYITLLIMLEIYEWLIPILITQMK